MKKKRLRAIVILIVAFLIGAGATYFIIQRNQPPTDDEIRTMFNCQDYDPQADVAVNPEETSRAFTDQQLYCANPQYYRDTVDPGTDEQ